MTAEMIAATDRYAEAEEIARRLLTAPPDDPYPLYDRLREIDPIHRTSFDGLWTLTTYDHIHKALRDSRFIRVPDDLLRRQFGDPIDESRPFIKSRRRWYNQGNPPEYTRRRTLYGKAFTRFSMNGLRPVIAEAANRLLDRALEGGGELEVVHQFGYELTVALICHVLGLPAPKPGGSSEFIGWFRAYSATFDPLCTEEMLARADQAVLELNDFMRDHIEGVRRQPGANLISRLIAAEHDGERLSDEVVAANVVLVFNAGVSTTTNLIANSVFDLLINADQWRLLVVNPEARAENAVEEILRYDTSVMTNPPNRVAARDVQLGSVTIPAGEVVTPFFGAGNHDPARYKNPHRLDITRPDIRPLSFGGGPHVCLGQHLARVETEVALAVFARRFPQMQLVDRAPKRRAGITNRGFEALPVRLT